VGRELQLDGSFEEVVRAAELAGERAAWQEAGEAWSTAAVLAMERGAGEVARECLQRAGEGFRRADRPRAAARALRTALALPGAGDPRLGVFLAGALVAVGDYGPARVLCEQALRGEARVLALDTLAGICLAIGDGVRFGDCVEALSATGSPAAGFRRAQAARNRGDLSAAWTELDELALRVAGISAGVAAVEAERAEILALRGDVGEAVARWRLAAESTDASGRTSLGWHLEAARVRALAWAGLAPLALELDAGLAFGESREMEPLVVDLLTARGLARVDRDPASAASDLDRAIAAADRLGEPLRAAKARLARARVARDPAPMLERAVSDAAISLPWSLRARSALARVRGDRLEAASVRAQLGAIGMASDRAALDAWLAVARTPTPE
jgi:hypothetical protein